MGHTPKRLDFSENKKLSFLNMADLRYLEELIFPPNHQLTYIDLSSCARLTPASVNTLIENIYNVSVANNTRNGYLNINYNAYRETGLLIGPPSAASLALLRTLRDDYGWSILPNELL